MPLATAIFEHEPKFLDFKGFFEAKKDFYTRFTRVADSKNRQITKDSSDTRRKTDDFILSIGLKLDAQYFLQQKRNDPTFTRTPS